MPDQSPSGGDAQKAPHEKGGGNLSRWLRARMPVPMAAPETPHLRRMRHTIIGLCLALAFMALNWAPFLMLCGRYALVALQALVLALIMLSLIWARAKWRADEAWLFREEGKGE